MNSCFKAVLVKKMTWNVILNPSLFYVDFNVQTDSIWILWCVRHQRVSQFLLNLKIAMFGNLSYDTWIFKKKSESMNLYFFWCWFLLKWWAIYRQTSSAKLGKSTSQLDIQRKLKGQEWFFTKKGNFLFSPCAIFAQFDPIFNYYLLADIYQFDDSLGKC